MIFEVSEKCTAPFLRDLLIDAARQRARGISWQTIARGTDFSALELARLPFDHRDLWDPLYKRAEKLQLQEAEGEGLKALNILLDDKDQIAAEKAARELLVHRRHIERSRGDMYRKSAGGGSGTCPPNAARDAEQWFAEEPAPEELTGSIIHLACRRAQGEDLLTTAAEIGRDHQEVASWPLVYPQAWDRCWPIARLETARFYAARALKTLTSLAFGPDRKLAARAARTLLIHRRHMHWNRENQPPRRQESQEHQETKNYEILNAAQVSRDAGEPVRGPSSSSSPWRLGGKRGCRIRDGPGQA